MAIIGEWMRRLGYLVRRRAIEDELKREMEAHRAMLDEPRDFGNALRLRDEARDAWGWTWLDDLVQDTRVSLRALRRSPGFALTAVMTLALGIGVNIGMFSVVNGVLLRPLYQRPGEVVQVYGRSTAASGGYRGISYPNYRDLREGTTEIFTEMGAFVLVPVGLDDGAGARRAMAAAVTADYFQTLGVPLALGRPFTPDEERLGGGVRVAIVSHRFWEHHGADPNVLGRLLRVNGEQVAVIGVAAQGFTGASVPGPELWLPLGADDVFGAGSASERRSFAARDAHDFSVVGRLQPGASPETGAPALATVSRRLEQAFPAINAGYTLEMSEPSRLAFVPGPGSRAITASLTLVPMVMPAIVLLVACLNLVDLLLARGQARRQEIAIRSSLGGGRGRLMRQLLTEGLVLAVAGGVVGLFLSRWAIDVLLGSVDPVLPFALSLPELDPDWRVLAGAACLSVVATLVFSAWPAWVLTGKQLGADLKRQVGEERGGPAGVRIGNTLVILQIALSILLLASAGLFLMSALSATTADPGFRLAGGVLVDVDPGLAGYDEARGRQSHLALVDRLRTVPGVEAVTIGSSFPFSSFGDSRAVAPAGTDARSMPVDAIFTAVGRDYARAFALPTVAGRDFSVGELSRGAAEPVAIVDHALAQRLWPGGDALGSLIEFRDPQGPEAGRHMRVVGIVATVKHSLSNPVAFPHVYVPLGQHYQSAMTLQLRIADESAEQAMLATVARVVRDVDDRLPILRVETWRDHLAASLDIWVYRAGARIFSAFAGIALLLAIVGVYGVKSYVVSRRTREFGIRIAAGAHPRALLWQVLREGGRITAIGIGFGVLFALAAGRLFQGFLYGVDAVEPTVLVAAPLTLLVSSLLASYVPARRATKVDPTVALRSE